MKIMMVITGMQSGGAERVMATLCNELAQRHSVRLLSMKEAVSDYHVDDAVEFIGGNVLNQNVVKSVRFVQLQIDEWKPDVVLSFMTKSNIIALVAGLLAKTKVPIIIAERANPHNAASIFKFIRRVLYPMASGCVFQTTDAKEYYNSILKCDSVVLRNPLNPDFRVEQYKGIRKKKIVTVGRLSIEKNQKLLIDSFKNISADYPEYYIEIYGEGPLRVELQRQIEECGLNNKVFLMGRKDNVQQHIKDADIFVLPSNSEGMPNALLEAMALGLTCIATDCPIGGPRVIIDNEKNGILVPMNDVEALSQALKRIINDGEYALTLGENAKKIIEDFDTVKVCQEWETYIKKVYQESID